MKRYRLYADQAGDPASRPEPCAALRDHVLRPGFEPDIMTSVRGVARVRRGRGA
jgi:hypothetical protein